MSEAEARDTVARLEQRYQQMRQRATEVTQDVTTTVAISAWWTFFVMLVGPLLPQLAARWVRQGTCLLHLIFAVNKDKAYVHYLPGKALLL
jgi:hypothetical protein